MRKLSFNCWHVAFWLIVCICQTALAQSSAPTISSVSPNRIAVGSASTTVAVLGTGFANGMVVRLNNSQSLVTSFVSSTELDAVIPNISLTTPAIVQLSVFTGSSTSGSANLVVYSSVAPQISSVSPSIVADQSSVSMTFAGSGLIGCDLIFDSPGFQVQSVSGTDTSLTFGVLVGAAPLGTHTATLTKASIGSATATVQAIDGGSWQTFNIPDAANRTSASVTVLLDGRILVAGGFSGNDTSQPTASAGLIDPTDLSWQGAASLQVARGAHHAILLPDGRILALGGTTFGGSTSSAEIYDPAANMWTLAGFVRNNSAAPILMPSGKLLLLPDELFDPIAQTSISINGAKGLTTGCENASFAGTLLSDGTVFVTCTVSLDEMVAGIYNPSTDSVRTVNHGIGLGIGGGLSAIPPAYSIVLPDLRIFVQEAWRGNGLFQEESENSSFFVYDPVTDQFATAGGASTSGVAPMPLAFPGTSVLLPTEQVLIFGGGHGPYGATFNPSINAVLPATLLNVNSAGNSALLKDGRVLVGPPSPNVYSLPQASTFRAPIVSSISTVNTDAIGNVTIKLAGDGFLSNSGISYGSTPIRSIYLGSTTSLAFVPASLIAASPNQLVTVTNPGPGGGSSTPLAIGSTFQPPAPTISGISPATGAQGSTFTATLTGTNLSGVLSVTFGTGITATVQAGGTATQIPVLLVIAGNATPGTQGVTVVTSAGSATLNSAFTVQRANIPVTVPQPIPAVEQGSIQPGYVVITPNSGSPAPTITATFGIPGGGTVESQAGMFPGPMTTDATLFVETIPGISRNLGIAVANPGSSANAITLTLRDGTGAIVSTPTTLSLQAGQQTAQFVNQMLPADIVGAGFRGSLELQSSAAFSVLGFLFSGNAFSTVPIGANAVVAGVPVRTLVGTSAPNAPLAGSIGGASAIILPQFAMGGGWATQLALVNSGATAIAGRIDIFNPNGDPLAVQLNGNTQSTFTYSIAPGGTFVLAPQDNNGQTPF